MAFVTSPLSLAPRSQRDVVRCASSRRATFAKRFAGTERRAQIRAGAPEQISADELEAILKAKPGPLCASLYTMPRVCTRFSKSSIAGSS